MPHDIDIMCGKIERDTNIADTRRKRAETSSMQVKYLTEFASNKAFLHLDDCRVKPFNMPNSKFDSTDMSKLNKCECLLDGAGDRLFNEHIDATIKQIRCDFKVQVGGYNHRDKIGVCLLNQLPVIGVACNVKAAHSVF